MVKIKVLAISLLILLINLTIYAQKKNIKTAYFELQKEQAPKEYGFLSTSLPSSLRVVLRKSGFKNTPLQGLKIIQIYNRNEVIKKGKRIGAELVICGSYNVVKGNEIRFSVLLYDIKGKELVLQRLIIGQTGTKMFDMVDKAAMYLKTRIIAYLKNRKKIIALARKRRFSRNKLSALERFERLKNETEKSKVKIGESGVFEDTVKIKKSVKIKPKPKRDEIRLVAGAWIAINMSKIGIKKTTSYPYPIKDEYKTNIAYAGFVDWYFLSWLGIGCTAGITWNSAEISDGSFAEYYGYFINPNIIFNLGKVMSVKILKGLYLKAGFVAYKKIMQKEYTGEFPELTMGLAFECGFMISIGSFIINPFLRYYYTGGEEEAIGDFKFAFSGLQFGVGIAYKIF